MEEVLLSSDLKLLNNAFMAIQAETQQEELTCFLQDTDTELMQVLSPGGQDHDYFHDINKSCLDLSGASKVFTDYNYWQPPVVQYAQSHQKETSSADKCHNEKLSALCIGEDLQPIYNEWPRSLSINIRVPNTSPRELGINLVSQNLPENIFCSQPSSQFIPGEVSYTKEDCLVEFINQLEPSSCTQGCVLKEELSVGEGQYSEGKHLSHVTSLYHGAYGKVDRCRDFLSGHEFIRKKIALDKFRPTEVLFPLTIKHTNIMKICGLIQRVEVDGGNVMEILMDNAGISMMEFVKNLPESETLSQTVIWDLTKQALEGLSMLHSEGIIHLDIKPENLCVREDNGGSYTLTITDFGSAMKANQQVDFVGWTPEYMSPESCRCYLQHSMKKGVNGDMNTQITGKADVFALGLTGLFLHQKKHVLLNLITGGRNSYNGLNVDKKKMLQLKLLIYLATEKDPVQHLISDECSMDMRDLLSRMISGEAYQRPTALEALTHMKLKEKMDITMSQSAAPKLDLLALRRRITRGKHSPSNPQSYQFTTDKGQLVTQPSCSSSEYTPMMAEVPVSRHYLPKSFDSLPVKKLGPIKDHTLKQKLREKLNPYLKGKILAQKEIEMKTEANNPTPMDVKSPCSPASFAMTNKQLVAIDTSMDIRESGVMEVGYNITQQQLAEQLGVTLFPQVQDTKPVQPSSHTDQGSNMVVLCGNIPNFDALN